MGALLLSLTLATVLLFRSLQGGGIEATSTVWFISVGATGLIFLKPRCNRILQGVLALMCIYLFTVSLGLAPNPVTQVEEPIFNFFFDIVGNIVVVTALFYVHNEIYQQQLSIIHKQENAFTDPERFSEGFEGSSFPPENWALINQDGDRTWETKTVVGPNNTITKAATSNYTTRVCYY